MAPTRASLIILPVSKNSLFFPVAILRSSWQNLGRMATLMGTRESIRNYAIALIEQAKRLPAIGLAL